MKLRIDDNKVSIKELAIPLSAFMDDAETGEFALKKIRENYEFVEGKKSDNYLSTTLVCINTSTLETIRIKCTNRIPLTAQDVEQSEEPIYIKIDVANTFVVPYAIEYGKAKVSITTPSVTILNN